MTVANILDPIHDGLAPSVWGKPTSPTPTLKPAHRKWIQQRVHTVLEDAGYSNIDEWLSLVLTGSLTTYQYDAHSDCDISLFVDVEHFPEWSRAEMIGIMVSHVDGTRLPGTRFPMQCFVVPPSVKREDLYKPGLRSGYDLDTDSWVIPPDRTREHDVQREMNDSYIYALETADKMERLLRYEPAKAIMLWHQIHERRRRDQAEGKGDYAQSNIIYKFLANRGLFPAIAQESGEYIAKTAGDEMNYQRQVAKFVYDPFQNHLVLGKMGDEEGELEHHFELAKKAGMLDERPSDRSLVFGQFDPSGRVETFPRPMVRGFGQPAMSDYESHYRMKQALEATVPGTNVETFAPSHSKWDLETPPQITRMGDIPQVDPTYRTDPAKQWEFYSKILRGINSGVLENHK